MTGRRTGRRLIYPPRPSPTSSSREREPPPLRRRRRRPSRRERRQGGGEVQTAKKEMGGEMPFCGARGEIAHTRRRGEPTTTKQEHLPYLYRPSCTLEVVEGFGRPATVNASHSLSIAFHTPSTELVPSQKTCFFLNKNKRKEKKNKRLISKIEIGSLPDQRLHRRNRPLDIGLGYWPDIVAGLDVDQSTSNRDSLPASV